MVNPLSCMRKVHIPFQYSEPTVIVAMGSGRDIAMSKVSQSIIPVRRLLVTNV